jgi:hypothetical protein
MLVQPLFPMMQKLRLVFPNKKLLVYDCGKLNTMIQLVFELKSKGHKIVIFT